MTYAVIGYRKEVGEEGLGIRIVGNFYQTERADRAKSLLEIANPEYVFTRVEMEDGVASVNKAKTQIRINKRAQRNA